MRIGILTFHWATNYGAILQSYALQEYLKDKGHDVEIINYKPKQYDFSWMNILRHPSNLIHLGDVFRDRDKEACLERWRKDHLRMTRRFYSTEELREISNDYDVFISGSDQILNPSFTLHGEKHPTAAYYLTFANANKQRLGYAVSFGCTSYPNDARNYATKWIATFNKIGVREQTGLKVLEELNFSKNQDVVPDPTVLLGQRLFEELYFEKDTSRDYLYVYMLRNRPVDEVFLKEVKTNILYADDNGKTATMENWLSKICNARQMITNSYHGMIMAILFHVPFVVLLETVSNTGMNDRFFTLLSRLGLEDRIVNNSYDGINNALNIEIEWNLVDEKISEFGQIGKVFLSL